MGSYIEINDTLQITREQGFPAELDYKTHLKKQFIADDFKEKVFEFKDKKGKRIYHNPPVRNFLVENRGGKWLYWGLIHIFETTYNAKTDTTSGKYRIIYIYTLEEMKKAHELIDRNEETRFF